MRCRRPGLELVVSPYEVGRRAGGDRPGRGHARHRRRRARRHPRVPRPAGGREGRAAGTGQLRTATGGLIWATSRHATTRAGDPQVHDHVLVANAVFDARRAGRLEGARHGTCCATTCTRRPPSGGWLRPQGRRARLRDRRRPGPSGRLGGWAIAGIPEEVCEVHSKRSGADHRRRSATTPPTPRARWRRAPPGTARPRSMSSDLLAGWQAELVAAGHPPAELLGAVEVAGATYRTPRGRPRTPRRGAARRRADGWRVRRPSPAPT